MIAAALWIGTVAAGLPAFAQNQSAPVAVDPVVEEPLSQTVPVIGRLVAVQRGTVAALARGPVLQVHVAVGDRVHEGDVLITQSMDRLERSRDVAQEAVDAALAAVSTARAQLQLAEQELARLDKLKESAAFSSAQREDKSFEVLVRRAQVGEANAEVARARALLAEAQLDVDLGVVRAPFDGVVIERHTVRGAYMNVGDPAITLINDRYLEVEADVPASRIAGLQMGREVRLHFGKSRSYSGIVRAVVPEENALTRTRIVRFIPDFDDAVSVTPAAGQTITVDLPVGEARDVVTVHKDAIMPRGEQNTVFVVNEDRTVAPRPVQLGEAVGTRFVVLDGLAPGDLVVIRGNERLQPGQAVIWPGAEESGAEARSSTSG